MKSCLLATVIPISWIAVNLSSPCYSQARTLTLDDAVRMAVGNSPDLRMADASLDKARAERASSEGRIAPRLSFEGRVLVWDSPTDVKFDLPPDMVGLFTTLADTLGPMLPPGTIPPNMSFDLPPQRVMDKVTGEVVLQAAQPLTPLYSLHHARLAREAGVRAAAQDRLSTRNTVVFQAKEAFLRLLAVRAMVGVARTAVEQVQAHLDTARSFFKAGLVGRDDVLRAETMLERMKDKLHQAQAGEELARAALNVMVGLPPGDPVELSGDFPEEPPPFDLALDECLEMAMRYRPELASVRSKARMADEGRKAAVGRLVPTLSAVARFIHQDGSEFQRQDSFFVGGVLTWDFWQWGGTWQQVRAAEADAARAAAGMEKARDGITLDVVRAYTGIRKALSAISANRKEIVSATENLRVVTKKYEASTATSVEVLDAQSSLVRANNDLKVALFQYYRAIADLERAMGTTLDQVRIERRRMEGAG